MTHRYDAALVPLPLQALFDLRGDRGALDRWCKDALPPLPDTPNRMAKADGRAVAHVGPEHWLARADLAHETALLEALRPAQAPPEISIVQVSDTLTFFRVTGPEAAEVLSIGCPMDLHPDAFAADGARYTEFFGLKAFVARSDDGFDLAVDQSYGVMTRDYLLRALG